MTLKVQVDESRYDRQERVTWWDQDTLRGSRVVVVGAGALGNELVKNLALVGIGSIVVLDFDVVEASNLARCVFFRASDEGRAKAEVLAQRAAELNPDVEVHPIVDDIRSFGTGLALRADVIVGALDNREARLYCNRLAARAGRAWVDGAIEALSGMARVFRPPGVCYECTLTERDWDVLAHRQSCRLLSRDSLEAGKVPTTASTSSLVAGVEAQEVVKLLHAERPGVNVLEGALVFDGANNDCYPLALPEDPECMAHHYYEAPIRWSSTVSGVSLEGVTATSIARAAFPEVDGVLTVDLQDDHVIGWACHHCGTEVPERRPANLIPWGDALCPTCNEGQMPEVISSIAVPGDWANVPLTRFGVRSDEILPVRHGDAERYVWLDDQDRRLPPNWNGDVASAIGRPAPDKGGGMTG